MATQGLDPTFGLAGTVTTEVSGYGGWPLAVTTGPDGRLTMLCSSGALPTTAGPLPAGHRFRKPPVRTLRVVSIPTGPVTGLGRSVVSVFGPTPTEVLPIRAIGRSDRFAALGTIIRANRQIPVLYVFAAGPAVQGVTQWRLVSEVELPRLGAVRADHCGLGWGPNDMVIVVAPALATPSRRPGLTLTLVRSDDPTTPTKVTVPIPPGLDLPAGFTIRPRATAVLLDPADRLTIGLTWEGLDPAIVGLRPLGTLDQARASVFRLRPLLGGRPPTLELDPDFATDGFWLANAGHGIVTTADFLAHQAPWPLVVAGQARQPGTSLFAAGLDLETGAEQWVRYPASGVLTRPTGLEYDAQGRVLVAGGTAEWDQNVVNDVSEAVVACLTANGDPDPGYPTAGLARFRLHGGTHPVALHAPAGGGAVVASVVAWGWQAAFGSWHPCLTRLTDAGVRDPGFGTAGIASHDGIGDSRITLVSGSGQVWSAGQVYVFLGEDPPVAPGFPPRANWLRILTVTRLTTNGELDPGFGSGGIAVTQLAGMLPLGKQFFDVDSLVPLASGKAMCGGWYGDLVPVFGGGYDFDPEGAWLARLTAAGSLDPTFGTGGLRIYPARFLALRSELGDGTLQGFESTTAFSILRLAADGSPAPGFGVNGLSPVTRTPAGWPARFDPDGGCYLAVAGPLNVTSGTVGLLRYRPDGTVDPAFGAGDPTNLAGRLIDIAATGLYGATLTDARPQTIQLADGTFLVVSGVSWQADVTVFGSFNSVAYRAEALLLLAFNTDGTPRPVAGWGNQAAKGHLNPLAQAIPLGNWLGWRPMCVLLQADGSIIVGLTGDDLAAKPAANVGPKPIRQTNYFCRLVPPDFALDLNFGTGAGPARGFAADRLHQEAEQIPMGLGSGPGGQVIAAIRVISRDLLGGSDRSPDLPLDGSLAVARLA